MTVWQQYFDLMQAFTDQIWQFFLSQCLHDSHVGSRENGYDPNADGGREWSSETLMISNDKLEKGRNR